MCQQVQHLYPGDTVSASDARHMGADHLASVLGSGPGVADLIDDCALVISELVTNSVNAGGSAILVEVAVHRDHVRIGVTDDGAGLPQVWDEPSSVDTHGRGLPIVEALSRSFGVRLVANGKEVWAELVLGAGEWAFGCELPIAS
jgi:anti-sigma regulatory factor (Ser/Thr protein kinase)